MKPFWIYITPFFPTPESWRGSYCYDFVKALTAIGQWNVRVFMPGNGPDYTVGGIRVCRFPVKELPSGVLPFFFKEKNVRSFMKKLEEEDVHVQEIDVCHGNTARLGIYPLAVKHKNEACLTLLHHHDLASFGLNIGVLHQCAPYNVWLFGQMRKIFDQFDCHVFVSDKSRESFLRAPDANWSAYDDYRRQMAGPAFMQCRGVRAKRTLVLHNGVDTSVFSPTETGTPRGTNAEFVIGAVGNFVQLKGFDCLIEAVARLDRAIRVRLVGSGPEEARISYLADRLHVDLEILHEMPHELLPEFYRSLDLFVLPSYFEGFGCVFAEAWACGTPFITCEGQGIGDLIRECDRDKWLCRPRDAVDLSEKISAFMEYRWEQELSGPIDLESNIRLFLTELLDRGGDCVRGGSCF